MKVTIIDQELTYSQLITIFEFMSKKTGYITGLCLKNNTVLEVPFLIEQVKQKGKILTLFGFKLRGPNVVSGNIFKIAKP